MEFHILGPLEVSDGGRALPLGGPKQRLVLAHLLLRAKRLVPAEILIEAVWGDEPPPAAKNSLQSYVSHLRTVLGGDVLEGRSGGYLLNVDPERVDALRFARLVTEARRRQASEPDRAVELFDEALSQWRGPALSDLAVETSLRGELTRLEELRITAVEDRFAAAFAAGKAAEAVPELEIAVADHPLRERLWGHLMLALYRSGRQADALAAFTRARAVLSEELGIDPSPELSQLHEQILRHDASLAPAPFPSNAATAGGAAGPSEAAASISVGRDRELGEFLASLEDALAGRGDRLPGEQLPLSEERKTVTVLFCDVEGSTSLGDRLDPESLRQVMMRFYAEMRAVLERHGGTVEKYIGDAVMGVFGVPRLHEDDAIRAVRAAAQMHGSLASLNAELEGKFGVRLRTRIGVNTGEVVVGNAAGEGAFVLGDCVNVAARLERAAPVGETLIGAETYALVRDHVTAEPVAPLELKGKPERVHAYRLIEARAPDVIETRPEPPLVGRATELETLRSAFGRSTAERESVLVTVLGSAGIGKSRLSREFISSLQGDALVLTGRSLPYGDGITFWPVAEVVKRACGIRDDDDRAAARSKLDSAVAGAQDAPLIAERLADLLGIAGGRAELQETFWAIRRYLEWLGRGRPVVLVLDDLQWAEPTLLDLVEYLAGWTRDTALLVLCLARPDLLDVRPTWGGGTTASTSLSLTPLDDDESRRLIEAALGGALIDEHVMDRIAESAGGNALFLEEIVRMLEDGGWLRRQDGRWVVAGDLSTVTIPPSIHALVGARLDRLSGEERAVVRCASVVGKVFWWGAVAELVPQAIRPRVGSLLQALVRKELIRPDRSTFVGEDGFRFHHILVQEAAYRSAPKELRADLHERFAGWVARTAGERAVEFEEIIGYHLEQAFRYRSELGAGDGEVGSLALRGARSLATAARRALERRDVSAAADLSGRAVRLFPSDEPERRFALLILGEALGETGEFARAEESLDEVERLAKDAGDAASVANATILRLFLRESTAPKQLGGDAEGLAERVIATLEELGDDAGVARAWRLVGDLRWARSRYAAADEAFARAISHARRAGDAREEVDCLGRYAGSGVYGPVHVREVERRCQELLSASEGIASREAPALRTLAIVRAMEGRFDEARELADRARARLEEFGFRLRASWVSEVVGAIEMLAGDARAAERALRGGLDAAVEFGDEGFQATVAALLAHALIEQGRLEEADRLTTSSEASAAQDDMASQVLWRSARARILAGFGAVGDAESFAREALALVEQTDDLNMHADTLVDLGVVLLAADRREEAGEALDEAIALYEDKGNVVAAEATRRRREALFAS